MVAVQVPVSDGRIGKISDVHVPRALCRDGSEAVRTFVVVNLSHKNMAIKVKGGINGIHDIRKSGDHEIIPLGMKDKNYLNPSSKDVIRRSNT